jgi:ABC-type multidrug transport system fused ATPase/permease subunit
MLIMMATIAALDLVGVGAIYPLLSIAINPSEVNQSWWMQWIQKSFGEIPLSMLMIIIAVALLFIYVFKAFITSYGNYYQYQFSYRFSAFLAHRVLKGYLSLAYPFFLTQNSSVLLKNVLTETNLITVGVLIPLLSLLSDNVVIIPLCILLIVISPAVYLYAGIAVAALFAISFLILRHRIITWGNEREQLSGEVNRVVHQSLFGVKEVKAINCEEVYLQRLIKGLSRYATLATYHVFFQSAPRIWIDFLIMTGLVIFILLTQQSNVNYSQLAPVLGVYVAAFYRILPLFNRTFTNVTTIAYYQASVFAVREALEGIEALEREEKLLDTQKGKIPTLRESICFKEVSYQYPLADQHSVYNINLEIPYGSRVAIVGASGAGKTTTVDLLLGLLEPTKGEIVIDGIHLTQRNSRHGENKLAMYPSKYLSLMLH